ncbi:MAG TPA: hypothetical protein VK191_05855 [Symbiobacteriaceae bacterium]|nr:hypothetical protein [Symbiobacteriaceae bacterium]
MFHVVVEWDPNYERWRAWWSADSSIAWLGPTPEEALNLAILNLTEGPLELQHDLPATVVAVQLDGTMQDPSILQALRQRRADQ